MSRRACRDTTTSNDRVELPQQQVVKELVPYWRWDGRHLVNHIAAIKVIPKGKELVELKNKLKYLEGGWVTVYNDLSCRWYDEIEALERESSGQFYEEDYVAFDELETAECDVNSYEKYIDELLVSLKKTII
jgi:hypothetical protein